MNNGNKNNKIREWRKEQQQSTWLLHICTQAHALVAWNWRALDINKNQRKQKIIVWCVCNMLFFSRLRASSSLSRFLRCNFISLWFKHRAVVVILAPAHPVRPLSLAHFYCFIRNHNNNNNNNKKYEQNWWLWCALSTLLSQYVCLLCGAHCMRLYKFISHIGLQPRMCSCVYIGKQYDGSGGGQCNRSIPNVVHILCISRPINVNNNEQKPENPILIIH